MARLHDSLTVIDGLIISKWSRGIFADMRKGGLTAANCTCSIWEGSNRAGAARRPTSAARKPKQKPGSCSGFKTPSAFEDQLGYISRFKHLGVGVVQITYNTQNLSGTGCYERHDAGISGAHVRSSSNHAAISVAASTNSSALSISSRSTSPA